jgi:ABC-type uncharacterized transport system permease subunit
MTFFAHLSAAGLYALAAAAGAGSARFRRGLPFVLGAGAVVHLLGFLGLHTREPPVPLESTAAALSMIGWLVVASYVLSLGRARTAAVGLWVGLGAALLTLAAALGLRLESVPAALPESTGAWPHAHVFFATAGFALIGLAALSGAAYIAKERALKRKQPTRVELPSLESLDRLAVVGLALGFPLLTLGVLSGYAWVLTHDGDPWSAHALFLLLAWLVLLVPVALRVVRRQRGRRVARSVLLGFIVLAFCYLGIRVIGGAG